MKTYFLCGSLALCLFALWVMIRRDWLRLTRPASRVLATVVDHRAGWDEGSKVYSAVFRFTDVSGPREVVDQLRTATPRPPLGSQVELCFPEGHPELARPPRVLLWVSVYALLIGLSGMVFARLMDWLPSGH